MQIRYNEIMENDVSIGTTVNSSDRTRTCDPGLMNPVLRPIGQDGNAVSPENQSKRSNAPGAEQDKRLQSMQFPPYPGEWRPVSGYPGYWISSVGSVASYLNRGRRRFAWKTVNPYVSDYGYLEIKAVGSDGRTHPLKIHRLIALAFIQNCTDGNQVRHLDSNRLNNSIVNLAWGTAMDNERDKIAVGTHLSGRRKKKLRESDVNCIRNRLAYGEHKRSIAKDFKISEHHVWAIQTGKRWGLQAHGQQPANAHYRARMARRLVEVTE